MKPKIKEPKYPPLNTLCLIRKKKGLTQEKLGEMTNISSGTIKALELGINNPKEAKLDTLLKLCNALNIKLKVLFPDEKRL